MEADERPHDEGHRDDDQDALLDPDPANALDEEEDTALDMTRSLNSFIAVGRPVLLTMVSICCCASLSMPPLPIYHLALAYS